MTRQGAFIACSIFYWAVVTTPAIAGGANGGSTTSGGVGGAAGGGIVDTTLDTINTSKSLKDFVTDPVVTVAEAIMESALQKIGVLGDAPVPPAIKTLAIGLDMLAPGLGLLLADPHYAQ